MSTFTAGWDNGLFKQYETGIEIDTSDVHYGYLSDGDKSLQLLGNVSGKRVLEICCGAAQNCIALAKQGATCTGVDIAPEAIAKAKELAQSERVSVELVLGDAINIGNLLPAERSLSFFDIVLSSYGIVFIRDFLKMLRTINTLLSQNGKLVFCGTHPCQFEGIPQSNSAWQENMLSKEQVYQLLKDAGFEVVKVLEQTTLNPSKIKPSQRLKFPYRVKNLSPEFDLCSNKPHTIIYSCVKKSPL